MREIRIFFLECFVLIIDCLVGMLYNVFAIGIPIIAIVVGLSLIEVLGLTWYLVLLITSGVIELIKKLYYIFNREVE